MDAFQGQTLVHQMMMLDADLTKPVANAAGPRLVRRLVDRLLAELGMTELGNLQFFEAVDLSAPGWSFIQPITTSHISGHYFAMPDEPPRGRVRSLAAVAAFFRNCVVLLLLSFVLLLILGVGLQSHFSSQTKSAARTKPAGRQATRTGRSEDRAAPSVQPEKSRQSPTADTVKRASTALRKHSRPDDWLVFSEKLPPVDTGTHGRRDYTSPTPSCRSIKPYPPHGEVVRQHSEPAVAPLTIKTQLGSGNYFVKLVDVNNPNRTVTVFLHGFREETVHMPLGTFELRYATGTLWYGEEELFEPGTKCVRADRQLTFRKTGNEISGYVAELYPQIFGNTTTTDISRENF